MKVFEILNSVPLEVELAQRELEEGKPVFFVHRREGKIDLLQVRTLDERGTFSPTAPVVGGKAFTGLTTYGRKHYSWNSKPGEYGCGWGDMSIGIADDSDEFDADYFKLFDGRPPILVIGRIKDVAELRAEYEGS